METQYIKCSGCRCLRSEDEYEIYKGTRRKSCLICKENREKNKDKRKEYHKEYREKIREKAKEYSRENYKNNKEQLKKKAIENYYKNIDENKERSKKYRDLNRVSINEKQKIYRDNNKDFYIQKNKEYREKYKCEHNKGKGQCCICNPQRYLVNLQRSSIKRMIKISNLSKIKPTIAYLGCSAEYFKEYLQKKMTDEMTFENIHIDHIKPVSQFNLNDPDEFLHCCHYTNLQPLLAKDNLEKNNKWTYVNEIYWIENIKGKETTEIYYSWKK